MEIQDTNTTYIIPLDALVLLLNTCNEAISIWSQHTINSVRRQNYFEFEMFAENNEKEMHLWEEINKIYLCNICNINVPIIYLKEHNDGIKHKRWLAIIAQAAVRLKNHTPHDKYFPNTKRTYFCDPCSVAVRIGNKDEHNNLDSHIEAVTKDNYLNELFKMFCEDKSDIKVDICENDVKISKLEMNTAGNVIVSDISNKTAGIDEDYGIVLEEAVISANNNLVINARSNSEDRDGIFCKVCDTRVPFGGCNSHVSGSKHRCLLKTNPPHEQDESSTFNHHIDTSKILDYVICMVCNVKLGNSDQISDHIESRDHINILKVNKVAACNRSFYCEFCDKYMGDNDILNHVNGAKHKIPWCYFRINDANYLRCQFCNIEIKRDEFLLAKHMEDIIHKINLDSMLELNHIEHQDAICTVCNQPVKKRQLYKHITTNKHKDNLSKHNSRFRSEETGLVDYNKNSCADTTIDSESQLIRLSPNKLSSESKKTAAIESPKNDKDVDTTNIVRNNQFENNTVSNDVIVNEKVKNTSQSPELVDDNVDRWMALSLYAMKSDPEFTIELKCIACNVYVPDTKLHIRSHYKGLEHFNNCKLLMRTNTIKFNGTMFMCERCDVLLEDANCFEHITSTYHLFLLKNPISPLSLIDGSELSIPYYSLLRNDMSRYSVPEMHARHAQDYENDHYILKYSKNTIFCKACALSIPNEATHVKKHMIGFNHVYNYNKIITHKTFIKIAGNSMLLCKICKAEVPDGNISIYHHFNAAKHVASYNYMLDKNYLIENYNNVLFCVRCNIYLSDLYFVNHIESINHQINISNTINIVNAEFIVNSEPFVIKNEKYKTSASNLISLIEQECKMVCETCNLIVPYYVPKFLLVHYKGAKAEMRFYNVFLGDMKDDELGDGEPYEACKTADSASIGHYEHWETSKDNINYNSILIENRLKKLGLEVCCELCNVFISEGNVFEHIRSDDHKKSLILDTAENIDVNKIPEAIEVPENGANEAASLNYNIKVNTRCCTACNFIIPKIPNNIIRQRNNSNYINYEIMFVNKLILVDDKLHCGPCDKYIEKGDEFDHIATISHKINYIRNVDHLSIEYFLYMVLTKTFDLHITKKRYETEATKTIGLKIVGDTGESGFEIDSCVTEPTEVIRLTEVGGRNRVISKRRHRSCKHKRKIYKNSHMFIINKADNFALQSTESNSGKLREMLKEVYAKLSELLVFIDILIECADDNNAITESQLDSSRNDRDLTVTNSSHVTEVTSSAAEHTNLESADSSGIQRVIHNLVDDNSNSKLVIRESEFKTDSYEHNVEPGLKVSKIDGTNAYLELIDGFTDKRSKPDLLDFVYGMIEFTDDSDIVKCRNCNAILSAKNFVILKHYEQKHSEETFKFFND